jgi:hypothetical protein
MQNDSLPDILLREFLSSPSGIKIQQIMETISTVQRRLVEIVENEDQRQLDLLRIGTVFQIFLFDVLATGKKPQELNNEDWKVIAEKVLQYGVVADGQTYSKFVFTLYANYIDLSVTVFGSRIDEDQRRIEEERFHAISAIASEIRFNTSRLDSGDISEVDYVENCLWLSLEAMVKLLSSWLAWRFIPENYNEFAQLAEAVADFGFECARYVHYAKEKQLLDFFIQHQYILDEQLQCQYEAYIAELNEDAARFQGLIDDAFSPNIRDSLINSAALARAAGVKENEILTSIGDVDAFFLN